MESGEILRVSARKHSSNIFGRSNVGRVGGVCQEERTNRKIVALQTSKVEGGVVVAVYC